MTQIKHQEHQRSDVELALVELREIHSEIFIASETSRVAGEPASETT